jgi:hypothetical protein
MNWYKIFLSFSLLFFAQIISWFQMFGQFKWNFLRNNLLLVCVMGIPLSLMFFFSTKWGVEGFGNSWSLRIVQFVMGIIIFTFLNFQLLGESLNQKNLICLVLCFLILFIQTFWK